MNSCLRGLAARTVDGFKAALDELQIRAPFYISQNDGTLMNADFAKEYPVLTFASGPTNSIARRGISQRLARLPSWSM